MSTANSRGLLHRRQILDIINNAYPNGILQHEILSKVTLSRQAIYSILIQLEKQDKVRRIGKKYYPVDHYAAGLWTFAAYLKDQMDHGVSSKNSEIFNSFFSKMSKKKLTGSD